MIRLIGSLLLAFWSLPALSAETARPNILWLTTEDIGPDLGCYAVDYAVTPHLDNLAKTSTRYVNAWSNAPVCAASRTTIITGIYPNTAGAEHMRSLVPLPSSMPLYPVLMRDQGYFCVNISKTDYNVVWPGKVWDQIDKNRPWDRLKEQQPFLAVMNFNGTHESHIWDTSELKHDPALAPLKKYHPDVPEFRQNWAKYHDNITEMDAWVGHQLVDLKARGLEEDTIVFFYGDHGAGMPRHKRWPYNSGLLVPLLVHVPKKYESLMSPDMVAGGASDRLVSFVDLAPTLLSLAGQQPPEWMQGHAFMGTHNTPSQQCSFGFRGRMDERFDLVRTVRNQRYQYIRNFMPHRIYGQYMQYMFTMAATRAWEQEFLNGRTNAAQSAFWKAKPPEELYDLEADPDEVVNLINSPEHQAVLTELREQLRDWIFRIHDTGFLPESEMISRAPESTPYELARDPARYPLKEIYEMANAASLLKADALPTLLQGMSATDSAVRYWAATGLLAREEAGYSAGAKVLRHAAEFDPSSYVRVVAAESIATFGDEQDLGLALNTLLQAANGEQTDYFAALFALNSLDTLGARADAVRNQIPALPETGPWTMKRFPTYITRMKERLVPGYARQDEKKKE